MRGRIRISLVAAAAAIIAAVLLAPATPAYAAGCYGDGCTGRDPNLMGCGSDAITAASRRLDGMLLELRHSYTCGASWARISDADAEDTAFVENNRGNRSPTLVLAGSQDSGWTRMVANLLYTPDKARAYGKNVGFNDNPGYTIWW